MAKESLDDLAAKCIRCGFCLESCPTFLLTGQETESPRGRIYLARTAEAGHISWHQAAASIDSCVGCRACETACPSGVEYGAILELARERIEVAAPHRTRSALLAILSSPSKLRRLLRMAKLLPGSLVPWPFSRLLSAHPPVATKPRESLTKWPPLDESNLPEVRGEVAFLEGCAMRVLFPGVNEAAKRLARRLGFLAQPIPAECCGALQAHSGQLKRGSSMAQSVIGSADGMTIVVNSAGCGSHLKDQGLGNTQDLSEFLVENGMLELLAQTSDSIGPEHTRVTYHDACHLAHGQGIRQPPRQLIDAAPGIERVELPESDLCCGSGGIYNLVQPMLARQMLDRKWANVKATGASICVLANPGCQAWIDQAAREDGGAIEVLHLAELLERTLSRSPSIQP